MTFSSISAGRLKLPLTAGVWIVLEGSSVSAQSSGTDQIKMFDQDSDGSIALNRAKVAGTADETAPSPVTLPLQYAQKEVKPLPFVDCVKACIRRMETAKAECAAREPPAHNYDTNKCVLSEENQVVECVRACNPSAQ